MIIDGRAIALEILEEVRRSLAEGVRPIVRAVSVTSDEVTRSYLRTKAKAAERAGMVLEVRELEATATTEEVINVISEEGAQAIIVQLPLPPHLDSARILDYMPEHKDADALSSRTRAQGKVVPPVAAAVEEILARAGVNPHGMRTVVLGNGMLVGKPVAARLAALGAPVTTFDRDSFIPEALKDAEIIVTGAGVPGLVTPELLTPGVVLIDAGTSEQGGVLVGDCDPTCAEVASVFTPVPGGIGPIAVACLFRNAAQLVRKESSGTL